MVKTKYQFTNNNKKNMFFATELSFPVREVLKKTGKSGQENLKIFILTFDFGLWL